MEENDEDGSRDLNGKTTSKDGQLDSTIMVRDQTAGEFQSEDGI